MTGLYTGWDTKIRNLLFGLFLFEQVLEINVQHAVNKYAELGQSKQTKQMFRILVSHPVCIRIMLKAGTLVAYSLQYH